MKRIFAELSMTDEQKRHNDEMLFYLKAGQYVALGVSVLLLLNKHFITGALALGGALYAEKAVASAIENLAEDRASARYVSANYSQLTKLTDVFNPWTDKIANVVTNDMKALAESLDNLNRPSGSRR